jgi:hypothetical protein
MVIERRVEVTDGESTTVNVLVLPEAGFGLAASMRSCGSDDFGSYGRVAAALMMFVGPEDGPNTQDLPLHHLRFLPPNEAVEVAARAQAHAFAAALAIRQRLSALLGACSSPLWATEERARVSVCSSGLLIELVIQCRLRPPTGSQRTELNPRTLLTRVKRPSENAGPAHYNLLVEKRKTILSARVHLGYVLLLRRTYRVVLPEAVVEELSARPGASGSGVVSLEWMSCRAPSAENMHRVRREPPTLGSGETEVIALGLELSCPVVLDDRKARLRARRVG